ncbi:hypothetical protein [Labrys wisconsinensis]|uniref:NHL repeat containing protein n=1 Tax=Labrys wisconsinensis TaxID=425677 RepID=A0ABU0JC63_9HYPH|nr:hypothetical protein [Labrys wisconsinensis]MDQ0470998.1 hypothetical protein [Labrys wisconsinensis]
MAARLTKPLVVPEYGNGLIKLYTPDPVSGAPAVNPAYTVDMQAVLDTLFPGQGRLARPNCCKLRGADLFVALSSENAQAVLKLPGYLVDPAAARAQAFVFTLDGSDYVGLAFDAAGHLYTAEGSYDDNAIVRYGGADAPYPGAGAAAGNTYAAGSKVTLGNAGATAYFADLAFDAAGNLWVTDYRNHRLVAFDAAGLAGAGGYHVLPDIPGPLGVANTDPALAAPASHLFAEPEGLDFDGFAADAGLWVANNNDGNGAGGVQTALTTLVRITKPLRDAVLATAGGTSLPAAQLQPNVNCFIYQVPNGAAGRPQFGGLQVDKAARRLYVNEQVGGGGRAYDLATVTATPANPAGSLLPITSTNPGNGGLALLELGAFVADGAADQGLEPDATGAVAWESPAISLTQANGGPLAVLPAPEDVRGGQACYLYVEVRNCGATPTAGIETLELRWAKASAGLGWPKPWDGSVFDAPPHQASPMGGVVATAVPILPIPAFGSVVVGPVAWTSVPDPALYTVQDGHFCLLARIVTQGLGAAGMSFPEGGDLLANTLNNARIAWRNIHVRDQAGQMMKSAGVIAANFGASAMKARLAFTVIDERGQAVRSPAGRLWIDAAGEFRAALARSSLGPALRPEGPVALPDIAVGITGLPIPPGGNVTLAADYAPAVAGESYALRISQFAATAAGERLVGGQTFVNGIVAGFPVAPPAPAGGEGRMPRWLWWLLAALILLVLWSLIRR